MAQRGLIWLLWLRIGSHESTHCLTHTAWAVPTKNLPPKHGEDEHVYDEEHDLQRLLTVSTARKLFHWSALSRGEGNWRENPKNGPG